MITHGPTGRLIKGDVLDTNPLTIERALKDYDPLLYVHWNPRKMRGWGCWEIRRRPELKSIVDWYEIESLKFNILDYEENDLVNHVTDAPFLNYSVVEKVIAMDVWADNRGKYFGAELEYGEDKRMEAAERKKRAELKYFSKHFKSLGRDIKEMVARGENLARIADHWDKNTRS